MYLKRISGFALGFLVCTIDIGHAEMTGREIFDQMEKRHKTRSEVNRSTMQLIDSRDRTKERTMVTYALEGEDGLGKTLMKFLAPPDIEGVGLLVWEQSGDQDDDQWLYLPASKKVKRIVASGKKNKFMGTDLTYEDMLSEDLDAHAYNLLRTEELDGHDCYVIEALPITDKQKKESGYGKRLIWVRKDILITVRTDYYDKRDDLIKRSISEEPVKIKDDNWRTNKTTVEDLKRNHKTVTINVERQIDVDLDEEYFTQRNLKKPN